MGQIMIVYALTALIPLALGFVWYHPKVLGTAWMKSAGITEETMKGANMALIFGLTYVFGFFLCWTLGTNVIHQFAFYSLADGVAGANDPSTPVGKWFADGFSAFGGSFRTFKHGALHGTIVGFTVALPVLGVNALFERKGFKYIAINAGFWIVCCAIMGAVICHFVVLEPIAKMMQ